MTKTIDLTRGNPVKLILLFALPIFAGNLFQLFYNIADTMIVGYALGDDALAAVGATSAISNLLVYFAIGMTNGFSLVVARFFGANNIERMKKAVAGTVVLTLVISVVLTIIGLSFSALALKLLNTPDEIFDMAYSYLVVIIAGLIALMLYNMLSGLLRALGNSMAALLVLIGSVAMNIGFDLLFVFPLNMGVMGAAVATVLAQGISVVLCLIYIWKQFPILKPDKSHFKLEKNIVGELFSTGLSMAFMLSIVSIGTVILQGAINGLGTVIITAHTTARRISEIFMLPISTLASASATFASQNYGAGKLDRIGNGTIKAILMSWIWSAFSILVIYLFSPIMVELLTNTGDNQVIETAVSYMRINLPFYFVLGILVILRSVLQGMGRKIVPLFSSSLELLGKFLVAFLLAPQMGYFGVCISEPIIWIVCAILLLIVFLRDEYIRDSLHLVFKR